MKVSIVIPVYNVEKYVGATLRSVQNQTMTDFEAIIINDGSTDNSVKMVEPFLSDKRFKLFSIENRGLAGARNEGVKHVTGEYLYFLDSDDLIAPNFLEIMVSTLNENPEAELISFNSSDMYDTPKKIKPAKISKTQILSKNELLLLRLNGSLLPTAWSYFVKTELFKKNGMNFPEGRLFEDESRTVELFSYTGTGIKIEFFDNDPAYLYRRNRSDSIMNKVKINSSKKEIDDMRYGIDYQYQVYKNFLPKEIVDRFYVSLLTDSYRNSADSLRKNNLIYFRQLRKNLFNEIKTYIDNNDVQMTWRLYWKLYKVKYDFLRVASKKILKLFGK